jgi:hypothetical protein
LLSFPGQEWKTYNEAYSAGCFINLSNPLGLVFTNTNSDAVTYRPFSNLIDDSEGLARWVPQGVSGTDNHYFPNFYDYKNIEIGEELSNGTKSGVSNLMENAFDAINQYAGDDTYVYIAPLFSSFFVLKPLENQDGTILSNPSDAYYNAVPGSS